MVLSNAVLRTNTSRFIIAFFSVALIAMEANADCALGCETKYKPVCGTDEITYSNECIAVCQGITVAKKGLCPADKDMKRNRQDRKIPKATMNKYKGDGYTLKGVIYLPTATGAGSPVAMKLPTLNEAGAAPPTAAEIAGLYAIKITNDGLVYAQSPEAARRALATAGSEVTKFPGVPPLLAAAANHDRRRLRGEQQLQEEGNKEVDAEGRELLIFGTDNRRVVTDTTVYPYSAIGRLTFSASDGDYICSASVISKTAILTAGHCTGEFGEVYNNFVFSPGAVNDTAAGSPFGAWNQWDSVTTYSKWLNDDSFNWDMAVITFGTGGNGGDEYLGDTVGTFGVATTCDLPPVTTTGYPGDRSLNAAAMYSQKNCKSFIFPRGCGDNIAYADCDVFPGQSGSPAYNARTFTTYAVCSFSQWAGTATPADDQKVPHQGFPDTYVNGFNFITPRKLKNIAQWAGI